MALFGKKPKATQQRVAVSLFDGDVPLEVVGESQYQPTLIRAQEELGQGGDVICVILPEPTNPHDPNAVRVIESTTGDTVGYLPRKTAQTMQPKIQRLMRKEGRVVALTGRLVGGTEGKPNIGVWLSYDPGDFG